MLEIMGKKLGMTHVYKNGKHVPVTVVQVTNNQVLDVRSQDKNGYKAVVIGWGEKKESRLKKPVLGYLKKNKQPNVAVIRECRTDRADDYKVGSTFGCADLEAGAKVDVQSRSKGRGFQGVMKRYNFAGGPDSHGCSVSHRVPGSIGQGTDPGKVIKGRKMPGHMGDALVTVKNLEIVAVESEQGLVLVSGSVPGSKNAHVVIRPLAKDFEEKVLAPKEEAAPEAEEAPAEEVKAEEAKEQE